MKTKLFISTQDQMKAVKTAWDMAPAGPKKMAALFHYKAAEAAMAAKNDPDCLLALHAASKALA